MDFFSPAKINLFLKVFNKRSDGYHNLATLMQAVSYFDKLSISSSCKDDFFCDEKSLPMDETNLCIKALKLFRQVTNIHDPVSIHLNKKIPMGAGLGGGSSNAATVLYGLSKLFNIELDFIRLSSQLGCDVPFFFTSGFAFAYHDGTSLIPLKQMSTTSCYLYFPHLHISTKRIFSCFERSSCLDSEWDLLRHYFNGDLHLFNDLQPLALKCENELVKHHDRLLSCGLKKVFMTGSGSAFVIYDHVEQHLVNELDLKKVAFIERENNSWYKT